MRSHTPVCRKYEYNQNNVDDNGQKKLSFVPQKDEGVGGPSTNLLPVAFSVEGCRLGLAEMLIIDELPFRFVENEGFRRFMALAQPRLIIPSRTTVARDCINVFKKLKK